MRYLLRRPSRDEIWSSMLIRSVRYADVSIGMAMRNLGVRGRTPSFFSMRHLQQVAYWISMDGLHALAEHTVLPYVVSFLDEDQRMRLTEAALSSERSEALKVAVAQGVVDYVPFRRYCAACALHELLTLGESFWHLSHHLPGMVVCTLHQSSLLETELTTHGSGRWSYSLPHEVPGRRLLPGRPGAFELELARRSIALLGSNSFFGAPRRSDSYRHTLLAKGLTYDLTFSAPKLALWLQHQMGAEPVSFRLPTRDIALKWAARMVRPANGRTAFPPVKHLILETAIALSDINSASRPN